MLAFGAYAFVTIVLFGAAYHMLPRMTDRTFRWPVLINAHFWLIIIGFEIYSFGLSIGGCCLRRKRDPHQALSGGAQRRWSADDDRPCRFRHQPRQHPHATARRCCRPQGACRMNSYLPLSILSLGILTFATLLLVIVPGIETARAARRPSALYGAEAARARCLHLAQLCPLPQLAAARASRLRRAIVGGDAPRSRPTYDSPPQVGTMHTGPIS